MKRILATAAALSAVAFANQAFAVDYCVGSTNGVDNLGQGNAGVPQCGPVGAVNQFNQNQSTGGYFNISTTPPATIFDGVISASLGRNGIAAGAGIVDRFIFTIPQTGTGSGTVSTSLSGMIGQPTDINFTSITLNGNVIPIIGSGTAVEFAGISGISIMNGVQNILSITYDSFGDGSYGGNLTFTPAAAVPEPATWAMMLAGFGAIGFGMRRKRKPAPKVRFAI